MDSVELSNLYRKLLQTLPKQLDGEWGLQLAPGRFVDGLMEFVIHAITIEPSEKGCYFQQILIPWEDYNRLTPEQEVNFRMQNCRLALLNLTQILKAD